MQNSKLKIQNLIFLFGICLLLFVFAPQAQAASFKTTGNPDDTPVSTIITAEAANETLNYTDINDNPKPQVSPPSNINVTVLPEYGFSAAGYRTPTNTGPGISEYDFWPGQTRYYYFGLTNEGNASDTYVASFEVNFDNAGPGNWVLELRRAADDSLVVTFEAAGITSTTESVVVAEDGTIWYYFRGIAPFPSTPEARINIFLTAETSSTPVGEYIGANGLTYGGMGYGTSTYTMEVARPLIELTRYSTVDAPKASVGFTGDVHAKVPGAIATYQMSYNNVGNSSAESVILVDKLPTGGMFQVNLAHICKQMETDNVIITYGPGNWYDWNVWYSSIESPSKDYGDYTGWNFMGTLEAGTPYFPPGTATFSMAPVTAETYATWLKFEKPIVPSGEAGILTYGVTIR